MRQGRDSWKDCLVLTKNLTRFRSRQKLSWAPTKNKIEVRFGFSMPENPRNNFHFGQIIPNVYEWSAKGYICCIYKVIRRLLNCWRSIIVVSGKGWFLPFECRSGGMLDRGKGCLVIGISRTGKRWIGVRIAWPGQHGGHFLMSPLPWKFSLDESSFGTIYDLVCSRQLKIITDAPPFCFSSTPQGEVIIDWIKHARFPPFTDSEKFFQWFKYALYHCCMSEACFTD